MFDIKPFEISSNAFSKDKLSALLNYLGGTDPTKRWTI
jgi:hypothetical protein